MLAGMKKRAAVPVKIRDALPRDVPELMRLKRLLAAGEDALHALTATEADWLRDGFGPKPSFMAFVAERTDITAAAESAIIGMATCSQRVVTGWNGPIVFLQDLVV